METPRRRAFFSSIFKALSQKKLIGSFVNSKIHSGAESTKRCEVSSDGDYFNK